MTDLAKLGFRADTGDLEKASGSLNKLKSAASGITPATQNVAKAMQQASMAFVAAAAGMTKAISALVAATQGASKTNIKAASDAAKFTQGIYDQISAQNQLTQAVTRSSTAVQKQISNLSLLNQINRVTGVTSLSGKSAQQSADVFNQNPEPIIPRDQMPNRFNTANIAAQFQDIGVTAAMGMNPLTIALQQGTQLSAILNSMEKPLEGIAVAFKSIINPVSLLSIGLTALVVVGIQLVNWAEAAQKFLFMVASSMRAIIPYMESLIVGITAFGTVMAIAFAPEILVWLGSLAVSFATVTASAVAAGVSIAAAWVLALSPVEAVIIAFGIVTAAIVVFQKQISSLLGIDILSAIKDGLNTIIGWFIGTLGGIVAMITEAWKKIKGESSQGLTEAFTNTFTELSKKDYVGAVTDTVDAGLKAASNKIKKFAAGIDITGGKKNHKKTEAERFADVLTQGNNKLATLQAEAAGLDTTGKAVAQLKYETELLNAAATKDITLTEKRRAALKDLSERMAVVDNQIAEGKFFKEIDKRTASLQLENETILMNADSADKLTNFMNLLNDAKEKNIELSPDFIEKLHQSADAMTALQIETRNLSTGFNFAKDVSKSFINDMRGSLEEGKSVWEAFGNAVLNVLDKILDKIVDVGINALFDGLGQSSGGKSIFSSIGAFINGSFGSTGTSSPAASPTLAAKGAAFTNGVYNAPTMFAFAQGGSFGVMGEAGPEAVMPLSRGPDGSLGVSVNNSGNDSKPAVNVEVVVNGNATVDHESSTMSDGSQLEKFIINTVSKANATGQFDSSNAGRYGITPRRIVR